MPQDRDDKRARQRKHITSAVKDRERAVGEAEAKASRVPGMEQILARENKRARAQAKKDISTGDLRGPSPVLAAGELSRDELYEEARRRNIKGRSSMTKEQLAHALNR